MKAYMLVLVAASLTSAAFLQPALAEGMRQTSSGASLDIMVEPQWGQDRQAQLKVSFLQPDTDTVQVHIDYDLKVMDSGGNEVFNLACPPDPICHTGEGVVTIPYKFEQNGSYTITIDMRGILFIPITPETAEFSVNVTPEFPAGALFAIAAVTAGAIATARIKKL